MNKPKPTKKDTFELMLNQAKAEHAKQKQARIEAIKRVNDEFARQLHLEISKGTVFPCSLDGAYGDHIHVDLTLKSSPALMKIIKKHAALPRPGFFNESSARRRIKDVVNGTTQELVKFYEMPATQKKIKAAINSIGLP